MSDPEMFLAVDELQFSLLSDDDDNEIIACPMCDWTWRQPDPTVDEMHQAAHDHVQATHST